MVFGKNWFEKHQQKLLWFLNTPLIKIWARWVLRIRKYDLPLHATIVKIEPNSFTAVNRILENGQPELRTDFRTHDKFAKRLYYAFKPFWYLFHVIDWSLFDRYEELNKLSFGFSTLTKYPGSIASGNPAAGCFGVYGRNLTWSSIIALTTANEVIANTNLGLATEFKASSTSNQWAQLYRGYFCFDTSSIGSSATISSVILSLYAGSKQDPYSNAPTLNIYTFSPASTSSVVTSDFGNVGSTAQCDSAITYANWTANTYIDFTFNSTGIGNISKTSVSSFCSRGNYDVTGTAPTWASLAETIMFADLEAENNLGGKDPKLVVTYSSSSIKTINGLTIGSTKTVNGLAIASVKTIIGLA